MSKGSYTKDKLECPFFVRDSLYQRQICCEGLVHRSSISLIYQRTDDYKEQLRRHCCGRYKCCPIYKALMSKYPDQ